MKKIYLIETKKKMKRKMKLLGIKNPRDLREDTVNHTERTHEIYMVHPICTIMSTVDLS